MASIQTLQLHTVPVPLRIPHKSVACRTDYCAIRSCNRDRTFKKLGVVVASGDSVTKDKGKNNAKKLPGHVMVVKFVNRSLPLLQDTVYQISGERQIYSSSYSFGQDDDGSSTVQSQPLPRDLFKIRQLQKTRLADYDQHMLKANIACKKADIDVNKRVRNLARRREKVQQHWQLAEI